MVHKSLRSCSLNSGRASFGYRSPSRKSASSSVVNSGAISRGGACPAAAQAREALPDASEQPPPHSSLSSIPPPRARAVSPGRDRSERRLRSASCGARSPGSSGPRRDVIETRRAARERATRCGARSPARALLRGTAPRACKTNRAPAAPTSAASAAAPRALELHAAHVVQQRVTRDPVDPGERAGAIAEPAGGAKDRREHFLRQLFCVGATARRAWKKP